MHKRSGEYKRGFHSLRGGRLGLKRFLTEEDITLITHQTDTYTARLRVHPNVLL